MYMFVLFVESLGLTEPSYYMYLNQSETFTVDGTDDSKEYKDTIVSYHSSNLWVLPQSD